MPNNSWFTQYRFPPSACLSLGPSQGIVYAISEKAVVKLPFQYPVNQASSVNEANEQIYMSLRSFALFKKESSIYDILSKKPHPNLAQRLHSSQLSGIVLKRFKSVKQAWSYSRNETRLIWIQQLLSGLEWLEDLGYTHGDIKIDNIGIDENDQLVIFDFGSTRHRDDEDYWEQVLQDHFALATCIHFLASGIDPIAKARSLLELRQIINTLKTGHGVVNEAAKTFEDVIQAGWTMIPRPASSFSQLRKNVSHITIVESGHQSNERCTSELLLACDEVVVVEKEERWLDEQDYRAAWQSKGYETPFGIWD